MGRNPIGVDMELMSSTGENLHTTFRDMQSGLKNSHTTNGNHNVNRRSRIGSRSLSPFGTKVSGISNKLSYVERVVLEIIETERMYVQDLRSIAEVCNNVFRLPDRKSKTFNSQIVMVGLGRVGQSPARFLIITVKFRCSLDNHGLTVSVTCFTCEE